MEKSSLSQGLIDKDLSVRLKALSEGVKESPREITNGGINLHIHTNESFSVFRSVTEAVWHAYRGGIEYFGINDHYTTAGYDEFGKACDIAAIKAGFGMEIKTMDEEAFRKGIRVNDPENPGRVYLIAKGITRSLKKEGKTYRTLHSMQAAIRERNTKIAANLKRYAGEKGYHIDFTYDDAKALTPHGNASERHVIQAFCEKIDLLKDDTLERKEIYQDLVGSNFEEDLIEDVSELQSLVRSSLIRSGKPCFVPEDRAAFSSVEEVIDIFREFGAVPTYSVMAEPITPEEKDIEALLKKVKGRGLFAFDFLEFRTGEKRAKEVIDIATHYGFPVFIGTEHNMKKMLPMIGEIGKNPQFYDYLRKSADFVIGHQLLSELCDFGYIDSEGMPRISDLKEGFAFFAGVGKMELSKEQIGELKEKDIGERRRYFNL